MFLLIHLFRTVFFFFFISLVIRFLGKREMGELCVFDFVILLIVADIAVIAIENVEESIWNSILAITILAVIQKLISFLALKFVSIRILLDGMPSVIVYKGKMNIKEMKKSLYTVDDLVSQLRLKNIRSINECEIAILEVNGELSVFTSENKPIPLPVIMSGKIVKKNLVFFKLKIEDVYGLLEGRKIKDIYCAYYHHNKLIFSKG